MLREPLRPGGAIPRLTLSDILSEVSAMPEAASGAGILGCRPRNPSKCSQSQSDSSQKSGCCSFRSSSVRNVVPEASFLTFLFPNLSLILNCDEDPLVPPLLSLGFVLGEIQCLSGHCVSLFVHHSSRAAQLRLSYCGLALMLWMYYSKLP